LGNNDLALRCLSVFPLQFEMCGRVSEMRGGITGYAGIAQLVERNLAKVEVASSSLVSRSNPEGKPCFPFSLSARQRRSSSRIATMRCSALGGVAKWLCSGLQSRVRRFDSGLRLQNAQKPRLVRGFLFGLAPSHALCSPPSAPLFLPPESHGRRGPWAALARAAVPFVCRSGRSAFRPAQTDALPPIA
jgi:hypothetical protein